MKKSRNNSFNRWSKKPTETKTEESQPNSSTLSWQEALNEGPIDDLKSDTIKIKWNNWSENEF